MRRQLRFGRKDIAQQHWIGLREVVRYRGGFGAVRCNHPLKAVLAWSVSKGLDLQISSMADDFVRNSTVWSTSRDSLVLGSPNLPSLVAAETPADLSHVCQQFIQFFYTLNDNTFSHSVYSDPNDSTHTVYLYKNSQSARKEWLFAPGTPLHRLLGSKCDSSMGLASQRTSNACQLPCLLYINAVVLEFSSWPHLIDEFFAKLISTVYEDNLDTCVSPEHLFIRLLVGINGTDARRDARLCEVTRLVYVAKRLGEGSLEKVRSALWRNLVLSDDPRRKERLFTWDPIILEAEILRD